MKKPIADIILCAFLGIFMLVYLISIYGAFAGVPDGFYHEGPLIYGWEAFCDQFFWCSFPLIYCGILPAGIIFNASLFIYKKIKHTLSDFEKIILLINSGLTLFGLIIYLLIFISEM